MANELTSLSCASCSPEPCLAWEFRTRNGFRVRVCEVCRAKAKIEFHELQIARLRGRISSVMSQRARQQEVNQRLREIRHA
jgi:hypothetical protein